MRPKGTLELGFLFFTLVPTQAIYANTVGGLGRLATLFIGGFFLSHMHKRVETYEKTLEHHTTRVISTKRAHIIGPVNNQCGGDQGDFNNINC